MTRVAKVFNSGGSQAVRLPREFRFDSDEVFIRKDPQTGEVILSPKPQSWDGFLATLEGLEVPDDFLTEADRADRGPDKDPFEDWRE